MAVSCGVGPAGVRDPAGDQPGARLQNQRVPLQERQVCQTECLLRHRQRLWGRFGRTALLYRSVLLYLNQYMIP